MRRSRIVAAAVLAALSCFSNRATARQDVANDPAGEVQDAGDELQVDQREREQGEQDLRRLERPSERLEEDRRGLLGLLLDWGGLRSSLEGTGLEIDLLVTNDLSWAPAGGKEPGATASRSLGELSLTFDTSRLLGHDGGLFHAGFEVIEGENGSAEIGTLQELSNIDAEDRTQLARVWYEQSWRGAFVRAGKMDANSLFAYVDNGAHFLHPSMGVDPTILGIPTYPDPAFGLALGVPLGRGVELRAGVFDGAAQEGVRTGSNGPATLFGQPADLFLIGELDATWSGDRPGRLGVGAWRHTGSFARFDGGTEDGTQGGYLVLDQRLWNEPSNEGRALDAFLQLGFADPEVTAFEGHLGCGLTWTHPFAPALFDSLGLGASAVLLSDEPGAGFTDREEIAFEAFYGFEPLRWLHFKPAVQYVVNPGGDASLDDALVLTLRTTFSL